MHKLKHTTAKPSHYDGDAKHYDDYREKNNRQMNRLVTRVLGDHNARSVLDLTCGTGSQVFWLGKRGFNVTGSDVNERMLNVAKAKARKSKTPIRLVLGDMRTVRLGTFDAAISMFECCRTFDQT